MAIYISDCQPGVFVSPGGHLAVSETSSVVTVGGRGLWATDF